MNHDIETAREELQAEMMAKNIFNIAMIGVVAFVFATIYTIL
jgi:hypothetical protein